MKERLEELLLSVDKSSILLGLTLLELEENWTEELKYLLNFVRVYTYEEEVETAIKHRLEKLLGYNETEYLKWEIASISFDFDALAANKREVLHLVNNFYKKADNYSQNTGLIAEFLNTSSIVGEFYNAPKEAILVLEKAIEFYPNAPELYLNQGGYLKKVLEYEKAIDHYKNAIRLGYNIKETYHEIALIYHKLKDWENEKAYYIKSIECSKNPMVESYNNLAVVLLDKDKKHEAALKYAELALDLDENYKYVYETLGCIYCQGFKDYEKSLEYFKKALELDDKFVAAHIDISYTYIALNQKDKAKIHLIKALEYDPKNEEAKKIYNRILSLDI